MNKNVTKPKERSFLRMTLGKAWFRAKRRLQWTFSNEKFAQIRNDAQAHELYFSHKTPLLRKLKDVDMHLQHNKIINLRIAAQKVNGVVLQPNETFSYWRLIGKPTRKKGYAEGMILDKGKVTTGTGGGLCQLSNLIYWITIHTPLTVIERHRHSFDVFPDANRTQPFGSGATCFYNYIDLVIKNETDGVFKLNIELCGEYLHGAWTSDTAPQFKYEVYEKDHAIQSQFWGGYTRHNIIHRKIFSTDGEEVADEFVVENNAIMMYNPLISQKNGHP
ncbi:MAG: VanW family protein [Defluviitaleaceae bacterium]|nr:VanW family protein [Defluviitaleaceae bacterium]